MHLCDQGKDILEWKADSPNHALTHKKLEIHVLEVSDTEEEIVDQFDNT